MKANISAQYSILYKLQGQSHWKSLRHWSSIMQSFQKLNLRSVFLFFWKRMTSFWSVRIFGHLLCRKISAASGKPNTRSKNPLSSMSILGHKTSKIVQYFTLKLKWKIFAIHFITETRVVALMQSVTPHTPSTGSKPELRINWGFIFYSMEFIFH